MTDLRAAARCPTARAHVAGSRALHGVAARVTHGRVTLLSPGHGGRCRLRRNRHDLDRPTDAHRRSRLFVDAGQSRLNALGGREHAQLLTLTEVEVVESETPEDVVHQ